MYYEFIEKSGLFLITSEKIKNSDIPNDLDLNFFENDLFYKFLN